MAILYALFHSLVNFYIIIKRFTFTGNELAVKNAV